MKKPRVVTFYHSNYQKSTNVSIRSDNLVYLFCIVLVNPRWTFYVVAKQGPIHK